MRRATLTLALLGATACGSGAGSSNTLAPLVTSVGEPIATDVAPSGFDSTSVELTEPDGTTCRRCLLLAATAQEHRRGLMGVTTLGGYDGMAFRFDEPSSGQFWMKDTLLPLSIAFYDANGQTLATFAMDPCVTEPCPSVGPEAKFSVAVEVEQGRLDELGFTTTARMTVLGTPCEPAVRTG